MNSFHLGYAASLQARRETFASRPALRRAAAIALVVPLTLVLFDSVASLADCDRAELVAARVKPIELARQASAEFQR